MSLLVGTRDGLYRATDVPFDAAERVLDRGATRVHRTTAGAFARAGERLFESTDGGRTWDPVETPSGDLTAFGETPDGRLLLGVHPPARLYDSDDGGETWRDLGFPDLPAERRWWVHENAVEMTKPRGGRVRALAAHPGAPDRLVVGVEPNGVYVTEDGGDSWEARARGLQDDVHGLLCYGSEAFLALCGSGCYYTGDVGRHWTRLDTDQTFFGQDFFHDGVAHEGRLHTAAATAGPGAWTGEYGAGCVLLESTDEGRSFEARRFPGGPEAFVSPFAVVDGTVLAGTVEQDYDEPGTTQARVIRRTDDGWVTAGRVPAGVTSIVGV